MIDPAILKCARARERSMGLRWQEKTAVIFGGGVGGLMTANSLCTHLPDPHRITLVEKNSQHSLAALSPALCYHHGRPSCRDTRASLTLNRRQRGIALRTQAREKAAGARSQGARSAAYTLVREHRSDAGDEANAALSRDLGVIAVLEPDTMPRIETGRAT